MNYQNLISLKIEKKANNLNVRLMDCNLDVENIKIKINQNGKRKLATLMIGAGWSVDKIQNKLREIW